MNLQELIAERKRFIDDIIDLRQRKANYENEARSRFEHVTISLPTPISLNTLRENLRFSNIYSADKSKVMAMDGGIIFELYQDKASEDDLKIIRGYERDIIDMQQEIKELGEKILDLV